MSCAASWGLVLLASCTSLGWNRSLTREQMFERSLASIVRIEARRPGEDPVRGLGFAIEEQRLVTSLELIDGAPVVEVRLWDGSRVPVDRVVAIDELRDLAVVRVRGGPLRPLAIAPPDRLREGDPVFALGDLASRGRSLEEGRFEVQGRVGRGSPGEGEVEVIRVSFPLDAPWRGAPLVDRSGGVVGVATRLSGARPFGLAVPGRALAPLLSIRGEGASVRAFAASRAGVALPPVPEPRPREREIPVHALVLLEGCSDAELRSLEEAIARAVERGAPIYNQGNAEDCFRIYEGMALRMAREFGSRCRGPVAALESGLERSSRAESYADRAWAMRDAFDGLIDVVRRSAAVR